MGISKAQRDAPERICVCGCGQTFKPFPKYRPKSESGGFRYPDYIRGHHPKRHKVAGWNKGMKKGDHPSLESMGFRPGHQPYTDWSHVNEKLRTDSKLRKRWLTAKKGQKAWNEGLIRDQYPNGIAAGPQHGNWAGGHGGLRDTAEYQRFRLAMYKRDKHACQECGDRNHKGRGSRIRLELDHIVPVCDAPERVMDPSNVRTLCRPCHFKTETFGSKAARKQKKLRRQVP